MASLLVAMMVVLLVAWMVEMKDYLWAGMKVLLLVDVMAEMRGANSVDLKVVSKVFDKVGALAVLLVH